MAMKLSENFTLEEMVASATARKYGIINIPDKLQKENLRRLCVDILQPIRDRISLPIIVTSGFRSMKLNNAVGGSPSSQHLKGEAADIICVDNSQLWKIILDMIGKGEIKVGQLINEKNLSWIHISLPTDGKLNQIFCIA